MDIYVYERFRTVQVCGSYISHNLPDATTDYRLHSAFISRQSFVPGTAAKQSEAITKLHPTTPQHTNTTTNTY